MDAPREQNRLENAIRPTEAHRGQGRSSRRIATRFGHGYTVENAKDADAGIMTTHEARMQQWKQQEDAQYTKQEMRDYYKSGAKGGKFKGKRRRVG